MTGSRGNRTADSGAARPQQPAADRITVALIPKASTDLQHLQDRTGLSKTDLVNRAITLYEFIDAQLRAGRDLLLRDNAAGETHAILIL